MSRLKGSQGLYLGTIEFADCAEPSVAPFSVAEHDGSGKVRLVLDDRRVNERLISPDTRPRRFIFAQIWRALVSSCSLWLELGPLLLPSRGGGGDSGCGRFGARSAGFAKCRAVSSGGSLRGQCCGYLRKSTASDGHFSDNKNRLESDGLRCKGMEEPSDHQGSPSIGNGLCQSQPRTFVEIRLSFFRCRSARVFLLRRLAPADCSLQSLRSASSEQSMVSVELGEDSTPRGRCPQFFLRFTILVVPSTT